MKLNLNRFSNLSQRILTALVGAALILAGCFIGSWTYFGVFFIITAFTLVEFYNLTLIGGMLPLKFIGTLNGLLVFTLSFLVEGRILPARFYFVLFPFLALIFLIKLYRREDKPFTNIAFTILGICYVGLPFSLLNYIVFSSGSYNARLVAGFMVLLWSSDIGGYFIGVRYGKRKLFERVSPKKSWEGMIGAFLFTLISATVLGYFFREIRIYHWYMIGIIIVITGTYGDLVESLFKRSLAIKDSSSILPGHGGFLDRFDGLLISLYFIAFYLKIIVFG